MAIKKNRKNAHPHSTHILIAKSILEETKGSHLSLEERIQRSVDLGHHLLLEAKAHLTQKEKNLLSEIKTLSENLTEKALYASLIDQAYRSSVSLRTMGQVLFLLDKYGLPDFGSFWFFLCCFFFKRLAEKFPSFFPSLFQHLFWREIQHFFGIIPLSKFKKNAHQIPDKWGIFQPYHHLLSEKAGRTALHQMLQPLAYGGIDFAIVKFSAFIPLIEGHEGLERVSRIFTDTVENLRLKEKTAFFDIDLYQDHPLALDFFERLLKTSSQIRWGFTLKSYYPDSFSWQKKIAALAKERKSAIPIRITKGEQVGLERIAAAQKKWPLPIFHNKSETDSNFKRMLSFALHRETAPLCPVHIVSHNLLDLSFGMLLSTEFDVQEQTTFEFSETMLSYVFTALKQLGGKIAISKPSFKKKEIPQAIPFLLQKLDKYTSFENFMRYGLIAPSTDHWETQARIFKESCQEMDSLEETSKRTQDRASIPAFVLDQPLEREPPTDFSLPQNALWLTELKETLSQKKAPLPPSPEMSVAAETAFAFRDIWKEISIEEKATLAKSAIEQVQSRRKTLISLLISEISMHLVEADEEVSRVIDALKQALLLFSLECEKKEILWEPKGTVYISAEDDLSLCLPADKILHALLFGNAVIFTPCSIMPLASRELIQCFLVAGFPHGSVQMLDPRENIKQSRLLKDPQISQVVLTRTSLQGKHAFIPPEKLTVYGLGVNIMVISSLCDREQAIAHLLKSAFAFNGQSPLRVQIAILEKELYENDQFLQALKEASEELSAGDAKELKYAITPLASPLPSHAIKTLTHLEGQQSWLVKPKQLSDQLWSPGIKMGIDRGHSLLHTPLLAPLLGIMKAGDFDEALELANATPYGLMAALQSLDEREQQKWLRETVAGLYMVNRPTNSHVYHRQPYIGAKQSYFGFGAVSGTPQSLYEVCTLTQIQLPKKQHALDELVNQLNSVLEKFSLSAEEIGLWHSSLASYAFWWNQKFKQGKDTVKLLGEDNIIFYEPYKKLGFRIQREDRPIDYLRVMAAALTSHVALEISWDPDNPFPREMNWSALLPFFNFQKEREEEFIEKLRQGRLRRARMISSPSSSIEEAAHKGSCFIDIALPLASGQYELSHYLRPQCLSVDYQRFGNLIAREGDLRKPII